MAKVVFRLGAVRVALIGAFAVLVIRAAYVQLARGAAYQEMAASSRTERVARPAPRGGIFDRSGSPLALSQEGYHVNVTRDELQDSAQAVEALVRHLGLSQRHVRRELTRRYAYFYGPFTSAQVQPLREVRGVHLEREITRFHPNQSLASMVLGMPAARNRLASGIERLLDTLLAGVPGSAVVLRDQFGRRYESPGRLDAFPVAGHDVRLTLDADLQDLVEHALIDAVDRYEALGGEVVVMNPRTGELLAVASRTASGGAPPTVFTSVFEPGSTAKIFAASALLAEGLVPPEDSVWGENGVYTLGRRTIEDETPEGWMTLRDVLRRSSNIGIAKFTQRLSPQQQYMMIRDFGLGTPTGVEFPAESPGILEPPHRWSGVSATSLAMGYELAVTMLQLAQAYGAIANDGVLLRPAIVYRVTAPGGEVVYRHRPEPVRRVVSAEVARDVRSMLRDVVYRGGTGETAALTSYEVAGKTGTARRAANGVYVPGSYTASFVAIFPAEDPQLVMAVKLDDPKSVYARLSAAPFARSMLEQVIAARTASLDRSRLAGEAVRVSAAPPLGAGSVPYVVAWPAAPSPADTTAREVPDVAGLSLRAAARALHDRGLRVRVEGWGRVDAVSPAAGTLVARGTLVTVVGDGREAGGRR